QLLAAQKLEEAIRVFRGVHARHPSIGALFNIAVAEQRLGRPVAAWAAYAEAELLARTRSDPRREQAEARAAELEPRLPRLVVRGDAPDDLVITVGEPVARAAWNGP